MTEQNQIEENKEKIVSQLLLAFPAHTNSAQHIDEILEMDNIMDTLRISQIDIIDMLSQPTLELSDIDDIIKQHNLLPLPEGQRPTRWQTVEERIGKHLRPYGITKAQWKKYHDDHYDAFDFPLIPKRSLSIPIDNELSGAWAPNGYGKTFMFKVLKLLQEIKRSQFGPKKTLTTQELFTDFLTKCTSLLHPIHSTTPLPYDGQRESPPAPRLIPFRQICFSIEALKDNHPTEFFSVRIEVEYEDTGKVSDYSLHLLAPNIADSLVVEGNIKLPNWINTNYHLEQISQDTLSGDHHTQWALAALEKLLCLNVNYIEIPLLAYMPNAGEFVQKNINMIVDNLLDNFTSHAYEDIEIDKYGLISNLADQQERYLLDALNKLYKELAGDEVIDKTDDGSGMNALRALINKITLVQKELNVLVNNDAEGWGVFVKIRTPTGQNALDILESETSTSMKSWGRLSFGQCNDLILQSTLAQYQHCYNANNAKDQVVLVIDEPEAGRSESWVNQLMHKLSTHVSTHPILILSHRGMVLESINSSGEYQIMHTVKPDIDEEEEESFKDYGVLQSKLSTTVRESLAFISAFSSTDSIWTRAKHPHTLIFPNTFTLTKEWLLLSEGAKGKQCILKPTSIDKGTLTEIEQMIDRDLNLYHLSPQELFLMLWNGISWVTSDISKAYRHHTVREWNKPQTQAQKAEPFKNEKIKYIQVGGLGLPKLEGLIFVLTHLPSHSSSSDVKALKTLATQEGLKISSTRIRNVRTIIHKFDEGVPPNKPKMTQKEQDELDEKEQSIADTLADHIMTGNRKSEADTLAVLGLNAYNQDNNAAADIWWQKSLVIYRELGERKNEADVLNNLGDNAYNYLEYDESIELYQESLVIYRELGDRKTEAYTLNDLGSIMGISEQYEYYEAAERYQESLVIYRDIGDKKGEAEVLNNLGENAYQESCANIFEGKDFDAATEWYHQSLVLYREIGDKKGVAEVLSNLGDLLFVECEEEEGEGGYLKSTQLHQESLAIYREIGDRKGELETLHNLATRAQDLHDNDAATEWYHQSLEVHRALGDRKSEADVLNNLGLIASEQYKGTYEATLRYQESLVIYREIGDSKGEMDVLQSLRFIADDFMDKPSFTQNLSKFISGLKMTKHSQPNMPDKTVLQKYISQLESFSAPSLDRVNTSIEPFIDYLKTIGVETPPQNLELTTILDEPAEPKTPFPEHFKQEYQKTTEKLILIKKSENIIKTPIFPMKAKLRSRDKGKHPTQANFDTNKYRWTQKTIDSAIMEAEINDYAEELVLQLASRYVSEGDVDTTGKIWIRADAFKQAAREIADRDVSSRKYDDFNDECGQFMLIRADIHGYTCLTCESMYDEKKNNI